MGAPARIKQRRPCQFPAWRQRNAGVSRRHSARDWLPERQPNSKSAPGRPARRSMSNFEVSPLGHPGEEEEEQEASQPSVENNSKHLSPLYSYLPRFGSKRVLDKRTSAISALAPQRAAVMSTPSDQPMSLLARSDDFESCRTARLPPPAAKPPSVPPLPSLPTDQAPQGKKRRRPSTSPRSTAIRTSAISTTARARSSKAAAALCTASKLKPPGVGFGQGVPACASSARAQQWPPCAAASRKFLC
mmetsp:Transcript_134742/g.430530  ORF Transcript_134742/g.430530 Transcript_134742/m.430530 type:complete len:246 (+) Transcript_134742:664-1401(+)